MVREEGSHFRLSLGGRKGIIIRGHQLPFKGGLNSEEDLTTWKCRINKLRSGEQGKPA